MGYRDTFAHYTMYMAQDAIAVINVYTWLNDSAQARQEVRLRHGYNRHNTMRSKVGDTAFLQLP